jgi:hypothetical protein
MAGMPGPRARRLVRRAHRTGWFAVAAAVLALLAGCTSGSRAGSPPSGSRLTAALGHWASFPASSAMRPVVLSGDQATAPDFPIGAAKIEFITGAISFPRSLPSGPSTSGGYPVISATRAASVLTSDGAAHVSQPSTRLTVTGVKLGTGVFGTDRGRQALPAWQFRFRGVSGTASVLAVAASGRFWPAGLNQVTTHLSAAQPGRSGRALTLTAEGAQAGTGPCQASYSVRQQSSAHAVAVYVVAVQHGSQGGCASAGYRVALAVPLPAPLGNRVLVDAATFAPIPVTQPLVSSS